MPCLLGATVIGSSVVFIDGTVVFVGLVMLTAFDSRLDEAPALAALDDTARHAFAAERVNLAAAAVPDGSAVGPGRRCASPSRTPSSAATAS